MFTVLIIAAFVAFVFFLLFPKKGNDVVQSLTASSPSDATRKEVLAILEEKLKEAEKQKRTEEAMEILGRLNATSSATAKSK